MGKTFAIVSKYSSAPGAEPKVAAFILQHTLSHICSGGKISKTFSVVFTHPVPITKPKFTAFIFQHICYIINAHTFLIGKMGKTFAIVFIYPSVHGTKPKVAFFILQDTPYL